MKQKIVSFSIIVTKLIRELIYLFVGLAIFGVITSGDVGNIDPTKKIYFILCVAGAVVLVLVSYILPHILKNELPREVAATEQSINKPHRSFMWVGIIIVIIFILAFLMNLYFILK